MKVEYLKLYWCSIKVFDEKGRAYGVKIHTIWDNLSFQILTKWKWYFDYRAALFKVQNPKCEVTILKGSKEPDNKTIDDFLKDKIAGKKRMISKLSNEIQEHKNWLTENNIFGLSGDDGRLAKAESKLIKYKNELQELENEKIKS